KSVENAVEAIRNGAYDFVTKPLNFAQLELSIERALKLHAIQRENQQLKKVLIAPHGEGVAPTKSPLMKKIYDLVARVAPSQATVLISGESGTGKEVIAKLIHESSSRRNKAFIAINCSAIPENLL